jgi:hypothetical protein
MEKPGEPKPISNMPKAQSKLATKACLLEQRKNKSAEIKITRKPGISRGNSKNPRWKSVIKKVSFKKLLKVESTILCANPKTKVAAKNSRKSRGNPDNLFLICRMIVNLPLNIDGLVKSRKTPVLSFRT